ncbi:3-phosphoshikimate 1-carboxyvinyltransferase [Devosia sp. 63-57]|uniref:3-phosphoshikimate 1-carboxyvinyltransferase n=1 Tax=Devosia sp. 63-57 TaxID=1895751 RepID=UPI00086A1116|nr:3-phosphoshikimate 1-carboxyvinyltransferase [Devosia sp. 63-57]ODT49214.1 MAG: 3-phosphoshikimate 1-carboxyvinyltransferase [Pelagibacterium sp. SCN 63-126]ODU81021.1 MAG: 3-phosphoshikimate 1-carboxyvinyltransferase [Pelagibacterium sp. SCN 63-17]OJX43483.1 MAG: 3-phosphoshikimate 1-carboxyvinyltransferase [Devosia sp. 63-57]
MPNALPPAYAIIPPNRPLTGRVSPPGSKSITNRALLLAALAEGTSTLTGALKSKDTVLMARALREMGVAVDEPDATSFRVTSTGRLVAPAGPLFLGNAGTATRFLTAAVATIDGSVVVDGDEDMRLRPIKPLVDALRSLGIAAESPTGCPPVTVRGNGRFGKGRVEIDGSLSSQYVSALLMAAPFGDGPIEVALTGKDIGARGYVDLTLAAMRAFGAVVEARDDGSWSVQPTGYTATDFHIEPDASAATYLWGIEALTGGRIDLGVEAYAFTQPDAAAQAIIASYPNMPAVIDGSQMQDAVPTMAVVAAFNNTPVRFVGIANLRVKETDRIRAVANELNRIFPGLAIEEGDDLLVASDPALASSLAGRNSRIKIETYHDHRIAMSFALAGLLIPNIVILDPACTGKTYPEYWDMLRSLGVELAATE